MNEGTDIIFYVWNLIFFSSTTAGDSTCSSTRSSEISSDVTMQSIPPAHQVPIRQPQYASLRHQPCPDAQNSKLHEPPLVVAPPTAPCTPVNPRRPAPPAPSHALERDGQLLAASYTARSNPSLYEEPSVPLRRPDARKPPPNTNSLVNLYDPERLIMATPSARHLEREGVSSEARDNTQASQSNYSKAGKHVNYGRATLVETSM